MNTERAFFFGGRCYNFKRGGYLTPAKHQNRRTWLFQHSKFYFWLCAQQCQPFGAWFWQNYLKGKYKSMTTDKLTVAVAAVKDGNTDLARQLLTEYLRENPSSEMGWLWLYACVKTVNQKRYCLGQALKINPNNEGTKQALAQLDNPAPVPNNIKPVEHAPAQTPQPISANEVCPKCGKPREINASFCVSCGYSFSQVHSGAKLTPTQSKGERIPDKNTKITSQALLHQITENPLLAIGVLLFALFACVTSFALLLIGIGMVTGNNQLRGLWSALLSLFNGFRNMVFGVGILFLVSQILIGIGYFIWRKRATIQAWGTKAQQAAMQIGSEISAPKSNNNQSLPASVSNNKTGFSKPEQTPSRTIQSVSSQSSVQAESDTLLSPSLLPTPSFEKEKTKPRSAHPEITDKQRPIPNSTQNYKSERKKVFVPYSITGPDRKELKRIITEYLKQGWTYEYRDRSISGIATIVYFIFSIGPMRLLGFVKNFFLKTELWFTRNLSIPAHLKHDYPLKFRRLIGKERLPNQVGRENKQQHYEIKNIVKSVVAYAVLTFDEKNTGYDVLATLFSDRSCRNKLIELRGENLYYYLNLTEQHIGKSGDKSKTLLGGLLSLREDELKLLNGEVVISCKSASAQLGTILYDIPGPGLLVVTVENEIFRVDALSKIDDMREKIILLECVMAISKAENMAINAELNGIDLIPYIE
jgi:hypothetical protein